MKIKSLIIMSLAAIYGVGCCGESQSNSACGVDKTECEQLKTKCEMKYQKKYTNADFYQNGVFNKEVALEAMKDMFEFYDVPFTKFMEENIWVEDFGLGDFENVGMGGIFWVNDKEHGYFAHDIYLLPNQMIPEHAHMATDMPAKFESWMVTKGWAYNFSEVGEKSANPPAIPASQGTVRSKNFTLQRLGEIKHLKKAETFHFLMAGNEGAIVNEWACYHDGAGLRFSNPKAFAN